VPTFPNATYLIPEAELAALGRGAPAEVVEDFGPLLTAGVVEPLEPPYEVSTGVRVVAAPGHSDGHVAVRVERDGALAMYSGHLVLSLLQIVDPSFDAGDADVATATRTRREVLTELAERRGLLFTTLIGGPGGGLVETDGDGFRLVAPAG
jgi:glyoxylase-like metal-dependent hydrolase (beta-lactamase superfamily II)